MRTRFSPEREEKRKSWKKKGKMPDISLSSVKERNLGPALGPGPNARQKYPRKKKVKVKKKKKRGKDTAGRSKGEKRRGEEPLSNDADTGWKSEGNWP